MFAALSLAAVRRLSRLAADLWTTPVIEAISPSTAEERIAAARRETAERARLHGLTEIHKVTADNVAYFAEHQSVGYAFTFKGKR